MSIAVINRSWKTGAPLREMEEEVAREKGINAETLRRMVAKVEEYSEFHRAVGLPDALMNILKDDLERPALASKN